MQRWTLESGMFVHLMHTYLSPVFIYYFSLLMLKSVLATIVRPWQRCKLKCKAGRADYFSPWGLPFDLQAVLLKIASLCLMPLLSQIQFPTWLSRSEMKPLCSRAACCMHCFPVVFREVLSIGCVARFCGYCFAWFLYIWSCLSYKRKSWGQDAIEPGIYAYKSDVLLP